MKVEPHLFAAFCAAGTACDMLSLLPKSDLVEELSTILSIQYDLFAHIMDGKHYGSDNLEVYLDYLEELEDETFRLKEKMYRERKSEGAS